MSSNQRISYCDTSRNLFFYSWVCQRIRADLNPSRWIQCIYRLREQSMRKSAIGDIYCPQALVFSSHLLLSSVQSKNVSQEYRFSQFYVELQQLMVFLSNWSHHGKTLRQKTFAVLRNSTRITFRDLHSYPHCNFFVYFIGIKQLMDRGIIVSLIFLNSLKYLTAQQW